MPIHSLTHNEHGAPIQDMICLGKLRKGAPKNEKGHVGPDLDHFRFDPEDRFANWKLEDFTLAEHFAKLYGDKPKTLRKVYVMGAAADEAFGAWMEEWAGATLLRRCDKREQHLVYEPTFNKGKGGWIRPMSLCDFANEQCPCDCKPVGRLKLILPDLVLATKMMGYVTLETHSTHDILTINATLQTAESLYGTLAGIPFTIWRDTQEVTRPNENATRSDGTQTKSQRAKVKKSLISIIVEREFAANNMLAAFTRAPALPEPGAPSVADVRNRLGAGSKPRRIGEPIAQLPATALAPAPDPSSSTAVVSSLDLDDFFDDEPDEIVEAEAQAVQYEPVARIDYVASKTPTLTIVTQPGVKYAKQPVEWLKATGFDVSELAMKTTMKADQFEGGVMYLMLNEGKPVGLYFDRA
ncbi:MAG: hypothetical protein SF123_19680 [Chloroflexota bacterium]|nr:hypothetical protein [Chloroflexota bacterium]